jgi:hypothetical protein
MQTDKLLEYSLFSFQNPSSGTIRDKILTIIVPVGKFAMQ